MTPDSKTLRENICTAVLTTDRQTYHSFWQYWTAPFAGSSLLSTTVPPISAQKKKCYQ